MTGLQRILQLEDDPDVLSLIPRVIAMQGISVDIAKTVGEAMQALDGGANPNGEGNYAGLEGYDAFLLDMGLPDGPGADVAKEIRARGSKKRIVMFSGADMQSAVEQTEGIPNLGYLAKPASIHDVVPALEQNDATYNP